MEKLSKWKFLIKETSGAHARLYVRPWACVWERGRGRLEGRKEGNGEEKWGERGRGYIIACAFARRQPYVTSVTNISRGKTLPWTGEVNLNAVVTNVFRRVFRRPGRRSWREATGINILQYGKKTGVVYSRRILCFMMRIKTWKLIKKWCWKRIEK